MKASFPRAITNSIALILGSVLAHHVAGGMLISAKQFMLQIIPLLILLILVNTKKITGAQLGFVIFFVQSFAHISLGAMDNSSLKMLAAHVIGGLISYSFVTSSAGFWDSQQFVLGQLIFNFAPVKIRIAPTFLLGISRFFHIRWEIFLGSHSLRGPPASLELSN